MSSLDAILSGLVQRWDEGKKLIGQISTSFDSQSNKEEDVIKRSKELIDLIEKEKKDLCQFLDEVHSRLKEREKKQNEQKEIVEKEKKETEEKGKEKENAKAEEKKEIEGKEERTNAETEEKPKREGVDSTSMFDVVKEGESVVGNLKGKWEEFAQQESMKANSSQSLKAEESQNDNEKTVKTEDQPEVKKMESRREIKDKTEDQPEVKKMESRREVKDKTEDQPEVKKESRREDLTEAKKSRREVRISVDDKPIEFVVTNDDVGGVDTTSIRKSAQGYGHRGLRRSTLRKSQQNRMPPNLNYTITTTCEDITPNIEEEEDRALAKSRSDEVNLKIEKERRRRLKESSEINRKIRSGEIVTNIVRASRRNVNVKQEDVKKADKNEIQDALDNFRRSDTLDGILKAFDVVKKVCGVNEGDDVYEKLKSSTTHAAFWCKQLWRHFDMKRGLECYKKENAKAPNVLVVGSGPAGLTTAIECAMTGSKVVLIDKRQYLTRNNILHLWPFTMDYLKQLNAKTFYSKFATGAIDHIGTKQIQRLLLKVALLMGVHCIYGIEFTGIEYSSKGQWKPICNPALPDVEFSVLVGAGGENTTFAKDLGFTLKEFSGSLSLGITVNFVNHHTPDEVSLGEFGISYIFQQKFFRKLQEEHDVDLENLVYYRGETHYFVMTAKKDCLIGRGLFVNLYDDVSKLIEPSNIDSIKLQEFLRDVAKYVGLPDSCEILFDERRNQPDMQIFDFTKRLMAEESVKVITAEDGSKLYVSLVGDALLQPFWPMGTGCNRAILSALDCAWMVHQITLDLPTDAIVTCRNSAYSKMRQSLAGTIQAPFSKCTTDPLTRYPSAGHSFQGL